MIIVKETTRHKVKRKPSAQVGYVNELQRQSQLYSSYFMKQVPLLRQGFDSQRPSSR